jgi:short-subunit dehydrogenase
LPPLASKAGNHAVTKPSVIHKQLNMNAYDEVIQARKNFTPHSSLFTLLELPLRIMNKKVEKRAVVVGATSGMGRELARLLVAAGWRVGIAGRRKAALLALQVSAPAQVETEVLDVTSEEAPGRLADLIAKLGGMDLFFLASGIGRQNMTLAPEVELDILRTNTLGFARMMTAAFGYFAAQGSGQLAAITSIAGTKGLGAAPAYSASKRFQCTYMEALAQQARLRKLNIRFTEIRPGFVDTALLADGKHYPLKMRPAYVARHIFRALKRRRRLCVVDWRYRLLVFFWKGIPRFLWERLPIRN